MMNDGLGFDVYYRDPLNWAHFLQRKAEACLNSEKYDEAISLHKEAAESLRLLLKNLQKDFHNVNIAASIQLQVNEHHKQEALIELRKKQNYESKLRRKNCLKHYEPFQDITYSNSSIESYGSSDYASSTHDINSETRRKEDKRDDIIIKRDDIINKMVVVIKQQQFEILSLSKILQEKDKESQKLKDKISSLENHILLMDSKIVKNS
ncbi:nuclear receptor-binding factor 2 isoform X1 [Hydra vulgaris]|uniref:nuclear receptor-binding factor 2 isoform X1 n=1 Tax=Hydra vulgaris TaxID=6087 RepID=UPI00064124B8|nr:nuclear receptor-binding factor 2 [Hydra vulgaris]